MSDLLYRASFYLYEISFLLLALALWLNSMALRKINQALHQPPWWIWSALGSVMLMMCSFNHYMVYHQILPQYLRAASQQLLLQMYMFKSLSMVYIFFAGIFFIAANLSYLKRIK